MTSLDWSIVIPTNGRRLRLFNTLAALERLDAPLGSFEVIVVDDGASDLEELPKLDLPMRLVRQPRGGPARARNRGAREARAPVLIFLDDDCAPEEAWLREISAYVTSNAAIGGSIRNGLPDNIFARASDLLVREFILAQYSQDSASYDFLPTANLAVPCEAFWRVGGFQEDFTLAAGEDRDFCRRWRQHGHRLLLAPTAIVNHFHDMRWRDFVRQHYRYGQGARLFYHAHPDAPRMSRRFYRRLLRAVFEREALPQVTSLTGLLAVSQVATAMGYVSRGA
jgi:GT2 family glycosyltransferase